MNANVIKIYTQEHRLVVGESESNLPDTPIASYSVATAKYPTSPKYWSTDYRNPEGRYHVKSIHRQDSPELDAANSFHVPWYLSSKAADPFEDAGKGVYGVGMIVLDYPNRNDLKRFETAKDSGKLHSVWEEFCEEHLKPIYLDFARRNHFEDYHQVRLDGDYGDKTYAELVRECPIIDPFSAFRLGVGIHGTNDPECIGTNKSAGCFRMHNEELLDLLEIVEIGMPVDISPASFYSM